MIEMKVVKGDGGDKWRPLIGPKIMQITLWRHRMTGPIKNGPIRMENRRLWNVIGWR